MIDQVPRWIIPSHRLGRAHLAAKPDVATLLSKFFFGEKDFLDPDSAANDLISVVADVVFDDITQFAPILCPSFDAYPTVVVKDPTMNNYNNTQ